MGRATHTDLLVYKKEIGVIILISTNEGSTKDLAKGRKYQRRAAQRTYLTYDYLQTNEESSQTNLNTLWDAGRMVKRTLEVPEKEKDREECL